LLSKYGFEDASKTKQYPVRASKKRAFNQITSGSDRNKSKPEKKLKKQVEQTDETV